MAWTFHDGYGVSDTGAMITREDDGRWCALPFGSSGGAYGVFAARDDAVAAAEMGRTLAACCQDDGENGA
jgi:hypothetical protein